MVPATEGWPATGGWPASRRPHRTGQWRRGCSRFLGENGEGYFISSEIKDEEGNVG